LDYPVAMCFNISKANQAISCDNQPLTVLDYYHMYEGFKFIGFIPKQSHFNRLMSKAYKPVIKVDKPLVKVNQLVKKNCNKDFLLITWYLVLIFWASCLIFKY
jgi:hypothetical protein